MPSSQLYRDGRQRFIKETKERYQKSKDLEMLQDFLMQSGSPQDAKTAALALQKKAAGKWNSASIGGAEIPSAWIEKLMSNMSYFVTVGDYAIKGAPESVGLAWCAVKLTLAAIHNNFDLYTFFGSALTDISEIMIIIPHYDELYDERTKADQWKASPIVEKLFQDIIDAYTAVLSFSFSIQRHLGAGTLARLKHGLKDFFGVSKGAFEGSMATIAAYKNKIIEDSQAIFQDKSLHQIDAVRGIVSGIEDTVKDIVKFQDTVRVMQEEQAARWAIVLENMADIKSTTKPKTPWDYAVQTFEKNKAMLNPQDNTSDALGDALDRRHQGTCNWIFKCSSYTQWQNATSHGILCIHGLEDSGKTTVLSTVVERLDQEKTDDTILLYMNCGPHRRGAAAKSLTSETVYNTLLYLLYNYAKRNENDLKLLEDCNNVFAIQRGKAKARSMAAIINDDSTDSLPEFVYGFIALATQLDANVIVAIDEVDRLGIPEQEELSAKMQAILTSAKYGSHATRTIHFLIGCRSASKVLTDVQNTKNSLWSVDVGKSNDEDMRQTLRDALQNIPGLTSSEKTEAEDAILKKAGPRFGYIGGIGIPFMREPFRRPLSERLDNLPKGMDSVYDDALSKMSANYIELLRTALLWSLFAPVPLRLSEIMDAYHGNYKKRGQITEDEATALDNEGFPKSSVVEIEQLQNACGPFLRLEAEVWSDDYIVHLQDPTQVRDFCVHAGTDQAHVVVDATHVCARCKTRTNASNNVKFSAKEAHLKLALGCLRTMNDPSFQKRSTATKPYLLGTMYVPGANVSALQNGVEENDEDDSDESDVCDSEDYYDYGSEEYDEDSTGDNGENNLGNGEDNGFEEGVETASAPVVSYGDFQVDESEIVQLDVTGAISLQTNEPVIERAEEIDVGMLQPENMIEQVEEIDLDMLQPGYMIDLDQDPNLDPETGGGEQSWKQTYGNKKRRKQVRDDGNESKDGEDRDDKNTISKQVTRLRMSRYEPRFWYYHVQQAEALWSPEERKDNKDWMSLFGELDFWTDNCLQYFNQWQTWDPKLAKYNGTLQPLHVAAYLGLTSWVSYLLQGGAEIDTVPSGMAETPLQVAGNRENSVEMLELLLQAKADPNLANDSSTPAFHKWLMKRSDMANVQLMLNHGADPTLANDTNGWTAIHCFAWQGHDVATLDVLLNHSLDGSKPNINAHDKRGNTPLHVLLWRREVPKILLEAFISRGADINEENNDSVRPLQMACLYGDIETLKVLCQGDVKEVNDEDHEGDTALQQAAISGHTNCVEFLLKFGANPNVQNHNGKVALHHTALRGTEECLQILLQHGAKPNVHDKRGRTPLFCACRDEISEDKAMILLKVLMEEKLSLAEINVASDDNRTPLREAAGNGFAQVVKTLIQMAEETNDFASLALNQGDARKGMRPLHRAAWLGKFECVQHLLAAKAEVDLIASHGDFGKTALRLAYEQWAREGQNTAFEDIVSSLIDADGSAPYDSELARVCAINGSSKLLRKLGGMGADLSRPDQYGWTPMALAQRHSQEEARQFLQQQAAWSCMLPTGWTFDGKHWTEDLGTSIEEMDTRVEHLSGRRICVSASPLPAGLENFYFEITIESVNGDELDKSSFPVIAIGFCTMGASAISFPGLPPLRAAPSVRSWGYHGHDGTLYASGQESQDEWMTGLRYRAGHTVGCGVNLLTETMWFTRDGQRLDIEIKGVHGRLFPVLGLKDEVVVTTNFTGPFSWQEENVPR